MKDLTLYGDQELSLHVFNDEYFYNERNYNGSNDYVLALVNEEFIYTPEQLDVLIQDLNDDRNEGNTMKVQNMTSNNGNKIANQFIVETDNNTSYFQSYDSVIAIKQGGDNPVILDKTYWNYSKTTAKYRNKFLNETTKETQAKIDSGEYILTNLN